MASTRIVLVGFACNDPRNGSFADECAAVDMERADDRGDSVIKWSYFDPPIPMEWDDAAGTIVLGDGDNTITLHVHVHRHHVGNWCWDQTTMFEAQAFELAKWLIKHADRPDEWVPDDPLGRLGEQGNEAAHA